MVKAKDKPTPAVGQIWKKKDKKSSTPYERVLGVHGELVHVENVDTKLQHHIKVPDMAKRYTLTPAVSPQQKLPSADEAKPTPDFDQLWEDMSTRPVTQLRVIGFVGGSKLKQPQILDLDRRQIGAKEWTAAEIPAANLVADDRYRFVRDLKEGELLDDEPSPSAPGGIVSGPIKASSSNGDGAAAQQPIKVTMKSKEVRFHCPCGDAHIVDEATTWDELKEEVERFADRHQPCLEKNTLPFGRELHKTEEATA
jgi:hypothetical protein